VYGRPNELLLTIPGRLAKGKILYAKGDAALGAMERATRCCTAILER
jgi:hypothetical protein